MRRLAFAAFLVMLMLLVGAGVALAWLLNRHPSLAPYETLQWTERAPASTPFKVTWLGVASLLLDDGETAILTDGFFSRPGKIKAFAGHVAPDLAAIESGLARAGVTRLAAVIPVHSHYDHAMDSPEVARRTGALLVGSESTANVGRGAKLPESQMRVVRMGVPMKFGRFTVTFYPSRHAPTGFTGGAIEFPLTPPARAWDYKEGQSYALLVQNGGKSLLINGTAGFEPGALARVKADVVMLGIGTLGTQNAAYKQAYWDNVVKATGARRVFAIHWEDFWMPSTLPMKAMPPPLDRFDQSMAFLREQGVKQRVDIRLPAAWQPMDVWAGLGP